METQPLLPSTEPRDNYGYADAKPGPKHILKIAIRVKELIDIIIPIQFDETAITRSDSPVITERVIELVKEAAGGKGNGKRNTSSRMYQSSLIFVLLTVKRWYDECAEEELFDAGIHTLRASAAEAIAQRIIESEDDERHLFKNMLCKRYSITLHGEDAEPVNALELAVDLHSTAIISTSGYQRCIKWLWRGWIVQDSMDPNEYIFYHELGNLSFSSHFNPDRLKTPKYQNYVQLFFCFLYLILYTFTINTLQKGGHFDTTEGLFLVFTLGGIIDDLTKFYHIGFSYLGFWTIFNDSMYFLVFVSFVFRINALGHAPDSHARQVCLMVAYKLMACCAPFVWLRIILYMESLQFFGVMLVILTEMINESVIFFVMLAIICIGFLQAFVALDSTDGTINFLENTVNTMLMTIMASPDFEAFSGLASPYGQILYYVFAFLITTLLLNILIALFGSAYSRIYENANDEYLAIIARKTLRFIRAPDSYVYVPPLNIIEIVLVRIPFGIWVTPETFHVINHRIMYVLYWPILLVTSFLEVRTAKRVQYNRMKGLDDDANERDEEWDLLDGYQTNFADLDSDSSSSDDEGTGAIKRRIKNSKRVQQLKNNITHETSEELEQMNKAIEKGDPEFPIDEKKWQKEVLKNAPKIEIGDRSGAGWSNYWLVKELSTIKKEVSKIRASNDNEQSSKRSDSQRSQKNQDVASEAASSSTSSTKGVYLTPEELSDIVHDAVKQALKEAFEDDNNTAAEGETSPTQAPASSSSGSDSIRRRKTKKVRPRRR